MIPLLPRWILNSNNPSFYDTESATAIEMVAKIYGSVNSIIEDYNKFVDITNQKISEFNNSTTKDIELFKVAIRQEFQDFIDTVELKIKQQDNIIKNAINDMNERLESGLEEVDNSLSNAITQIEVFQNTTKTELYNYVEQIYNELKVELPTDIAEEINTLKARLDNLLGSVTEGSTTLDVEVIDARLGYDNTQYTNLGEAVRTQVSNLHSVKLNLPVDESGSINNGTAGQFATSDGNGGITWITVVNGNEVEY